MLPKLMPKIETLTIERGLFLASLPVLGTVVLNMVIHWSDTLFLGFYRTAEVVGMYNVARPLAQYISYFLYSAAFIFLPVISFLYSKNEIDNMKKIYTSVTKWMFTATLPVFLILFLAPRFCLALLFGEGYLKASSALSLLSLGFFFHIFVGLNGTVLIAIGKQKFTTIDCAIAAIVNIILNFLLIPKYGLMGAAIATAVSFILSNILASIQVYLFSGIHPFKKHYLKPAILSIILSLIIFTAIVNVVARNHLIILHLGVMFLLITLLSILITKSVERNDIMIMQAIGSKVGINPSVIERKLKKFIQE